MINKSVEQNGPVLCLIGIKMLFSCAERRFETVVYISNSIILFWRYNIVMGSNESNTYISKTLN